MDRVNSINEINKTYVDCQVDWEVHFYDIIGVTTEKGELEEIELLFSKEQSNYIKTKPLHPSQKVKEKENGELLVKLKLIPNYELEVLLLSFAEKVKVISPLTLKNRVLQRLKESIKQYL